MNSIDFFNSLDKYLNDFHNNPYKSVDEGLIYVGLNEKYNGFKDEDEKIYFVNYLCMIVSLDLKFYELNNCKYYMFKSIYNIPKFEYGLSNTYCFPNAIYYKFDVLNKMDIFKGCFDDFYSFYSKLLSQNELETSLDSLLESMITDKDINSGSWGNEFCRLILQKLEK